MERSTVDGALVLALDQGSSATKALVLDGAGTVRARARVPVAEHRPRPGWVEQDAEDLADSLRRATAEVLAGLDPAAVVAVGLSNQRESLVLWERRTGRPVGPVVSWQDHRTTELCRALGTDPVREAVPRLSGLPLDPMFSALKGRWLLDRYDPDRSASARGELCLGTVDSWLLSRFGDPASPRRTDRGRPAQDHVVEIGNASRTQLLDLATGDWSAELLAIFDVPAVVLPRVVASDGPFPAVRGLRPLPDGVPVRAVLGDSHAALYGHRVCRPGPVKVTYGTGSSVLALGDGSAAGLCRTVAWQLGGERADALEGNIRATGATLGWLAGLLGTTPAGLAELADGASSDGVHLVPGFNGLAAPWWDPDATGVLTGLSLATGRAQLARAALESVAFQVNDVVEAVRDAGVTVTHLLADGGASGNATLMRLQADLTGVPVRPSRMPDASALGAALLAGRSAGLWAGGDPPEPADEITPSSTVDRKGLVRGWHDAVRRARGYGGIRP